MTSRDGKGHSLVLMLSGTHRGKTVASCWGEVNGAFVSVPTFLASLLDAADGVPAFPCLMDEMSSPCDVGTVGHGQGEIRTRDCESMIVW